MRSPQDPGELRAQILGFVATQEQGVATEEICRQLNVTPQDLGDVFEALKVEGEIVSFSGTWILPERLTDLETRLRAALEALHLQAPKKVLVPKTKAASQAEIPWAGKPLERLFQHFAAAGWLTVEAEGVRLKSFKVALTPRQRLFLDRAIIEIEREPLNVPGLKDLAEALNAPRQAVEGILELGVRTGELVGLGSQIWYTPAQLDALAIRIKELTGGESLSVKALRDGLGTTRKYVLPLLDYFERVGLATVEGDRRIF